MPSQQRRLGENTTVDDPSLDWDQLLLSFDMHNRDTDHTDYNPPSHPENSDEIQTTALLAQLAMFPPTSYSGPPGTQRPRAPPGSMPSTSYAGQAAFSYGEPSAPPPPPPSYAYGPPSPVESIGGGRSRASRAPASPDAEDVDEYEDKRRRNTAASARFRIKKKQKALELERSVSDLTGRAEELEREAADLRRENGWLKEIVMLKGGRLNVSEYVNAESSRQGRERPSRRGGSEGDGESDSESSEEEEPSRRKGKGKSRKK